MSNEVRELLALKAICSERKLKENTKFALGLSESDPGLRKGPVRNNGKGWVSPCLVVKIGRSGYFY